MDEYLEKAIEFSCLDKKLYGILHIPDHFRIIDQIVLMIVGGPQTRVGSHRLYVQFARKISEKGFAVFRFDYEGIGDSEGK